MQNVASSIFYYLKVDNNNRFLTEQKNLITRKKKANSDQNSYQKLHCKAGVNFPTPPVI